MRQIASIVGRRNPDVPFNVIDISTALKDVKRRFGIGSIEALVISYHSKSLVFRKFLADPTCCVGQHGERVFGDRRYPPLSVHTHCFIRPAYESVSIRGVYSSSRCSMPSFETFALVIVSGIHSGLPSGACSRHAHPS